METETGIRQVDTFHDEDDVGDDGQYLPWDELEKKRQANGYYAKKARENRLKSPPGYPSSGGGSEGDVIHGGAIKKQYMESNEWVMLANHDKFQLLHMLFLVVFVHMCLQGLWMLILMISLSQPCDGLKCIWYTIPMLGVPIPMTVVWIIWKVNVIRSSRALATLAKPWSVGEERLSISGDSHMIEMDTVYSSRTKGQDLEITVGEVNPGIIWTQKDVTMNAQGQIISHISTWASAELRRKWGCKPLIVFIAFVMFGWLTMFSVITGWYIVSAMAHLVVGTGGCIFELYVLGRYLRENGYIGGFPCDGAALFVCIGTYCDNLGPCCDCFDGSPEEQEEYYEYEEEDNVKPSTPHPPPSKAEPIEFDYPPPPPPRPSVPPPNLKHNM